MIDIIIDGRRVIPAYNTAVKLVKQNPYFTKSANYTYEITLPMHIADNRKVFGNLNRLDISKQQQSMEAMLLSGNVIVISGVAHITQITESDVKVQILGELAGYNYGNKMADTYIDELDLGDWYWTTFPDGSYYQPRPGADGKREKQYYDKSKVFRGSSNQLFYRASFDSDGVRSDEALLANLFSGEYPWVALPTHNSSADVICNKYSYRFKDANKSGVELKLLEYDGEYVPREQDERTYSRCVQPYVWIMAEKVAEATGFTLSKADNELYNNDLYKRLFIVNTNTNIQCSGCLPHWSVNEWWTEIENTFGLVMEVDFATRHMTLKPRAKHYKQDVITEYIDSVVYEYTTEMSDTSQKDISSNSVGYADYDNDPADRLSEYIIATATYNDDYANIEQLHTWAAAQGATAMAGYKDYIWRCADGRRYIYSEADGIIEVDMLRNRLIDESKTDVDIELRIVPARYIDAECELRTFITAGNDGREDKSLGGYPVRILEAPGVADMSMGGGLNELDIEAIINGDEEEGSTNDDGVDVLPIAIANLNMETSSQKVTLTSGGEYSATFKYPRAWLRERGRAALTGTASKEDYPYSLSLIPITGQNNIAKNTIVDAIKVDTTVLYCIAFISSYIPDVGAIYNIHNRLFVCERLEVELNAKGFRKEIKGYFYEYTPQ